MPIPSELSPQFFGLMGRAGQRFGIGGERADALADQDWKPDLSLLRPRDDRATAFDTHPLADRLRAARAAATEGDYRKQGENAKMRLAIRLKRAMGNELMLQQAQTTEADAAALRMRRLDAELIEIDPTASPEQRHEAEAFRAWERDSIDGITNELQRFEGSLFSHGADFAQRATELFNEGNDPDTVAAKLVLAGLPARNITPADFEAIDDEHGLLALEGNLKGANALLMGKRAVLQTTGAADANLTAWDVWLDGAAREWGKSADAVDMFQMAGTNGFISTVRAIKRLVDDETVPGHDRSILEAMLRETAQGWEGPVDESMLSADFWKRRVGRKDWWAVVGGEFAGAFFDPVFFALGAGMAKVPAKWLGKGVFSTTAREAYAGQLVRLGVTPAEAAVRAGSATVGEFVSSSISRWGVRRGLSDGTARSIGDLLWNMTQAGAAMAPIGAVHSAAEGRRGWDLVGDAVKSGGMGLVMGLAFDRVMHGALRTAEFTANHLSGRAQSSMRSAMRYVQASPNAPRVSMVREELRRFWKATSRAASEKGRPLTRGETLAVMRQLGIDPKDWARLRPEGARFKPPTAEDLVRNDPAAAALRASGRPASMADVAELLRAQVLGDAQLSGEGLNRAAMVESLVEQYRPIGRVSTEKLPRGSVATYDKLNNGTVELTVKSPKGETLHRAIYPNEAEAAGVARQFPEPKTDHHPGLPPEPAPEPRTGAASDPMALTPEQAATQLAAEQAVDETAELLAKTPAFTAGQKEPVGLRRAMGDRVAAAQTAVDEATAVVRSGAPEEAAAAWEALPSLLTEQEQATRAMIGRFGEADAAAAIELGAVPPEARPLVAEVRQATGGMGEGAVALTPEQTAQVRAQERSAALAGLAEMPAEQRSAALKAMSPEDQVRTLSLADDVAALTPEELGVVKETATTIAKARAEELALVDGPEAKAAFVPFKRAMRDMARSEIELRRRAGLESGELRQLTPEETSAVETARAQFVPDEVIADQLGVKLDELPVMSHEQLDAFIGAFDTPEGFFARYGKVVDGKVEFTPAGEELVRYSIQRLVDGVPTQKRPVVYAMAGGGGSGKGFVQQLAGIEAMVHERQIAAIDPDAIKAFIPEYRTLTRYKETNAAFMAHTTSSKVSKEVYRVARLRKVDVLQDRTLSAAGDLADTVKTWKADGYRVELILIDTPQDAAVRNAMLRATKSGRFVPKKILIEANQGAVTEIVSGLADDAILRELDAVAVVHNSADWNEKPRVILEGLADEAGEVDFAAWDALLEKGGVRDAEARNQAVDRFLGRFRQRAGDGGEAPSGGAESGRAPEPAAPSPAAAELPPGGGGGVAAAEAGAAGGSERAAPVRQPAGSRAVGESQGARILRKRKEREARTNAKWASHQVGREKQMAKLRAKQRAERVQAEMAILDSDIARMQGQMKRHEKFPGGEARLDEAKLRRQELEDSELVRARLEKKLADAEAAGEDPGYLPDELATIERVQDRLLGEATTTTPQRPAESRESGPGISREAWVRAKAEALDVDAGELAAQAAEEAAARPGVAPVVGEEGTLRLADGRSMPVRYELRDARDVIPSHDARRGFKRNAEGDLNERPYESPRAGAPSRQTVQRIAGEPDPKLLAADTPSPVDGPPIVTGDGVVLGGNARAMATQLAYEHGGQGAAGLRAGLIREAEKFGIDPAAAAGMEQPVVVRVLTGDPGKPGEMSRVLNEAMTTGRTAEADAASRGAKISVTTGDMLAGFLGDDTTIAKVLDNTHMRGSLLRALRNDGAISDADLARWVSPSGKLNAAGKVAIEELLLGSVLPDPTMLADVPASIASKITRAMPSIIRLRQLGAFDVRRKLALAVEALQDYKASFARSLDDYLSQTSFVTRPWDNDGEALALMWALENDKPTVFADKLRTLANRSHDEAVGQGGFDFVGTETALDTFWSLFQHPALEKFQLTNAAAGESVALFSNPLPQLVRGLARAIGVTEDALNRVGAGVTGGAARIASKLAAKMANTTIGRAGRVVKDLVGRQVVPMYHVPREAAALIREAKAVDHLGRVISEDWARLLSRGGESDLLGIAVDPKLATKANRDKLGKVLRGEAPESSLSPELQPIAQRVRSMLTDLGEQAVEAGLLRRETFEKNKATYLARLYLPRELESRGLSGITARLRIIGDRFKLKRDAFMVFDHRGRPVTDEQGRIKFDTAEARDRFFDDLVDERTAKATGLTLDEIRNPVVTSGLPTPEQLAVQKVRAGIMRSLEKIDPLDEATLTKMGVIRDPAYPVAKAVLQLNHDIALARLFRDVAGRMDWVADNATPGMVQLPAGRRYGALSGKYVLEPIAREIEGLVNAPSLAIELYDTAMMAWKKGKTVYNPATHGRNMLGNLMFADLAGVSPISPDSWPHYMNALRLLAKRNVELDIGGGRKLSRQELIRELHATRTLAGGFASAELERVLSELALTSAPPAETPIRWLWTQLRRIDRGATGAYQLEDELFKVASYLKSRSEGMSAKQAAAHVRKWFPFYDELPKTATMQGIRRTVKPFLSFYAEALRIGAHAARQQPVTVLKYAMLPWLITRYSAARLGLTDADVDSIMGDTNGGAWLTALLPFRDAEGRLQAWDLSNVNPYADLLGRRVDTGAGGFQRFAQSLLLGNPLSNLLTAYATNSNPFFGTRLVDTGMTQAEQAAEIIGFTGKTLLPPLTPGVGQGWRMLTDDSVSRGELQKRNVMQQRLRTLAGVDIRNVMPKIPRMIDDYVVRNDLAEHAKWSGDTTPASRARARVYQAVLDSDQPKFERALSDLAELGQPIKSLREFTRLLGDRHPLDRLPNKERTRFMEQLTPIERQAVDRVLGEYDTAVRRAREMLRSWRKGGA